MASPVLGQFFGVDPFQRSSSRSRVPELPVNYGTGFSPDGLSYSVIDDFDKLASQALAEYEARVSSPRSNIWGETLDEDKPDFLDRTILEPVRRMIGGGRVEPSNAKTFEIGNQLIQLDPQTNQPRVLFSAPPPAVRPFNADEVALKDLMRRRSSLEGNMLADPSRIKSVDEEIGRITSRLQSPVAMPPLSAPQPFAAGTNQAPAVIRTGSGKQFKVTPR